MSGSLIIAGLGPGSAELITPEVSAALAEATDLIGYAPYVARVAERAGLVRHGSDNREELDRAGHALRLAAARQARRRGVVGRSRRVRDGGGGVRGGRCRRSGLARSRYPRAARHQRDVRRRGTDRRAARP